MTEPMFDMTVRTGTYGEQIVDVDYRRGPGAEHRDPPSIRTAGRNADPEWVREAWAVLLELVVSGVEFSADDVREAVTRRPHHPGAWGALFRRAAGAGLIERAGTTTSRTAGRNGSLTRTWRGRP